MDESKSSNVTENDQSNTKLANDNNFSLNQVKQNNSKMHEISDSYDFNVNNMLEVLSFKTNNVMNTAKSTNKIVPQCDNDNISNRIIHKNKDLIEILANKSKTVINSAKSIDDAALIKEKIKFKQQNTFDCDNDMTGVCDIGDNSNNDYQNDNNDMKNILKILSKKIDTIVDTARKENDILAISNKVRVDDNEKLVSITASKSKYSNSDENFKTDDLSYKNINEAKKFALSSLIDQNQTDAQLLISKLKETKKKFIADIMDT